MLRFLCFGLYFEDGRNELYDIKEDVGEQTDQLKMNPKIASKLMAKLDTWLGSVSRLWEKVPAKLALKLVW